MKQRRIHLAFGTALGVLALVSFSNQANAGAFAYADLQITSFEIQSLTGLGGTIGSELTNHLAATGGVAGGTINVTGAVDTFTTSAVIGPGAPTVGPTGTGSSQCAAGGVCPNATAFPFVAAPPITHFFSQSTTSLVPTAGGATVAAPIISFHNVGDPTPVSIAGGASARTTTQSQITGGSPILTAAASGIISLNSGFTFNLTGTAGGTTSVNLSLSALLNKIAGTDAAGLAANANSAFSISITDLSGTPATVLSWAPGGQTTGTVSTDATGAGGVACGFGTTNGTSACEVITDPFSLQSPNATVFTPSTVQTLGPFSGGFDIEVTLNNADNYSFVINHQVVDQVTSRTVPEPGSLALFAAGLLALGAFIRRSRSRA